MAFVRWFVSYFHFVGWSCIQLGFHVDVASPNIELHVPFGFFRFGIFKWEMPEGYTLVPPSRGWKLNRTLPKNWSLGWGTGLPTIEDAKG